MCSCGYPCHIFNKYVGTYVTELLCCTDSFTIGGRVFLHTTETLSLWPLTLWQPWGVCLSDLTCSNWPTNYLTLCFARFYSRDPFFTEKTLSCPELILLCFSGMLLLGLVQDIVNKCDFTVNNDVCGFYTVA